MKTARFTPLVSLVQGIYYLATGFWPILDRRSFEAVTGPKVDFWLVKTIGALIAVIGAALSLSGLCRRVSPETTLLGVGAAASLAGSDLIYTARRRIRPIYRLEAVPELGLIALWLLGTRADTRRSQE